MAIFSAIGAALVSAFMLPATILGVSTAALVGGALAIGASVALQSMGKKKLNAGQTPQAQAVINQTTGPRVRGYGRAKLGGTRAFWDSLDGQLVQAIMMHSGEIDAVEQWWLGDTHVVTDANGSVLTEPYAGWVLLYAYLGTANQAASVPIMNTFYNIWSAQHRLRGIAYIVSEFASPQAEDYAKVFPEGYNTPVRAVCRLSKVYDPRTGVTAWSDNAALVILDYLTHSDGYGRTMADIDIASFIAFANVCGEIVPLKSGGAEPRYRIWGVYTMTEDPQDVLDRMKAACDAELYQTPSGKIAIRGGKWTEPTVTITEADILGHQLEQGNNRFAAFNELKILHTSPAHDYQTVETASWVDVAAQAEQGPLLSDLSLDLVPSNSQALRLAKIHIAKSNPRWRGSITTNLAGLNALSERTIRLVLPELEINETFLVLGFSIRPDLTGCEITIASLSASAYEWNPATEELNSAPPPQDTRPDLTIAAPQGLSLRVVNRQVAGGTVAAVVRATVDAPTRSDLSLYAEMRTAGGNPGPWQAMSVAAGTLEAFSDVVNTGVTYEVRARWLTSQGTAGEWTATKGIPVVANPASPADPTGFTATKSGANAALAWTHSATSGFYFTEVYRGTTATFANAVKITEVYGNAGAAAAYTDTAPGAGPRYYWVRSVNVSGAASSPVGPQSVTF
jgi:hypothetical protein